MKECGRSEKERDEGDKSLLNRGFMSVQAVGMQYIVADGIR